MLYEEKPELVTEVLKSSFLKKNSDEKTRYLCCVEIETRKFSSGVEENRKTPQKARECGLEGARNNIHKIGQVNNARCISLGTSKKFNPIDKGSRDPNKAHLVKTFRI